MSFLTLLFSSCNKQDEVSPVVIEVLSPQENEYVLLPDTMHVEVSVSSEIRPEYVKICITNEKLVTVYEPYYFYLENSAGTLQFEYVLENKDLSAEGQLYLLVSVAAKGISNSYTKIKLESRPLEYTGFYLFTEPGVNETSIAYYESGKEAEIIKIFGGNFVDSEFSPVHDLLFIQASATDRCYAYQWGNDSFLWQSEPTADYPFLSSLYADATKVFCGFGNGMIAGFSDVSGKQIFSTPVMKDSLAIKLFASGSYLVADVKAKNKPARGLQVYFKNTGARFQRTAHNMEILEFYSTETGKQLLVFGNENGRAVVCRYFFEGNYFSKSRKINESQIELVCKVNENLFLYSQKNKLYLIDIKTLIQKQILTLDNDIVSLNFDHKLQTIFIAAENTVYLFTYPSINLTGKMSSSSKIRGMELRYAYN